MSTTTTSRLTYTTAWTRLESLTFDQLALLAAQVDKGLETGRSTALWLNRWERLGAEMRRRGVVVNKDDLGNWAVGYGWMFDPSEVR